MVAAAPAVVAVSVSLSVAIDALESNTQTQCHSILAARKIIARPHMHARAPKVPVPLLRLPPSPPSGDALGITIHLVERATRSDTFTQQI